MNDNKNNSGFTLIEMSIVLVIIGLIVGGILVGQDLIAAAAIRAQISQIERYNTAVNTFRNKYGYLPGDIPDPQASSFGFAARGVYAGEGDGNGIIEGIYSSNAAGHNVGVMLSAGETAMFWVDLATANLIDGAFNTATSIAPVSGSGSTIDLYMPNAKIGSGNYIYDYSFNGINYYGISSNLVFVAGWNPSSTPGLTVQQAYNIDKKIDDGLPQSGSVTAQYDNHNQNTLLAAWAAGGGLQGANSGGPYHVATTSATPYATTNCYDNGGNTGTQQYSTAQNATAVNCALSFKFQ